MASTSLSTPVIDTPDQAFMWIVCHPAWEFENQIWTSRLFCKLVGCNDGLPPWLSQPEDHLPPAQRTHSLSELQIHHFRDLVGMFGVHQNDISILRWEYYLRNDRPLHPGLPILTAYVMPRWINLTARFVKVINDMNVVDPKEMVERYGSEVNLFTMVGWDNSVNSERIMRRFFCRIPEDFPEVHPSITHDLIINIIRLYGPSWRKQLVCDLFDDGIDILKRERERREELEREELEQEELEQERERRRERRREERRAAQRAARD
ncbi:hypothetical protein BXZ70DRAFT_909542 [Cristinia sonorae]|uniref:Uncharacterized protein n=1 Tax=Cristinia sonorae TaxID=1940300 RepID=A0A8K0UIN9_9AGAR|nr:hypothetical protein BXZ70DRAFT_909542 [Cristinia sonorae]